MGQLVCGSKMTMHNILYLLQYILKFQIYHYSAYTV